jgi:antitoxin VapB
MKEFFMETAQLVTNEYGQSVLLPEDCRLSGKEVYIKKIPEGLLLIPKNCSVWDIWEQNLMKYEEPFMIKREQPAEQQERAELDALFD